MPRKKIAHVEEPVEELIFEEEVEEREDENSRHNGGGLDIYDENGELLQPGEPTYIEEDEEDD